MGSFTTAGNFRSADPRLVAIAQAAAAASPYNVVLFSGERGGNSRSQHYGGNAIDVVLIDPATGREIPNLGAGGDSFSAYQSFAQTMRATQQQVAPELSDTFRWGGYFGPSSLNQTGLDLMHFDLGPTANMALGTWESGLNDNGRAFVAQAGSGQTYSATQGPGSQNPQPLAYTGTPAPSAGQQAITAAAGPGAGVPDAAPAPGSQRLFRPVSEARAARQAGGTPRLDEITNIIRARRMGDHPIRDRIQAALRNWREDRQDAPTPPAPIPYAGTNSGGTGGGGSGGGATRGDPAVFRLQQELAAAGFDPGPIDGVMGPRTQAAIRARDAAGAASSKAGAGVAALPRASLFDRTAAALKGSVGQQQVQGPAGSKTPVPLPRENVSRPGVTPAAVSAGSQYSPQAPLNYSIPIGQVALPQITNPYAAGSLASPGSGLTPVGGAPASPRSYNPAAPMDYSIPIAAASAPQITAPAPGSLTAGSLTPVGVAPVADMWSGRQGAAYRRPAEDYRQQVRPLAAGERRQNPDGSYSTEITTTVQQPDGQWVNIPTLWMAGGQPVEASPDVAQVVANQYGAATHTAPQGYPTVAAAEAAAVARSQGGGNANGPLFNPVPPANPARAMPLVDNWSRPENANYQRTASPAPVWPQTSPGQSMWDSPAWRSSPGAGLGAAAPVTAVERGTLPAVAPAFTPIATAPTLQMPTGDLPGFTPGVAAPGPMPMYQFPAASQPATQAVAYAGPGAGGRAVETHATELVGRPPWDGSRRLNQLEGGVMPAGRNDFAAYHNFLNQPALYQPATLIPPGGSTAGARPVQTTTPVLPEMPPLMGMPSSMFFDLTRRLRGYGV